MRLTSLVAAVVFVAYAVPTVARIGVDGPNGFRMDMNASFEPGGDSVPSGVAAITEGRVHRFVADSGQQRYFAYDLVMAASGSDSLRVAVEPLSLSAAELAKISFVDRSWTAVPLLKPQAVQEVKTGDRLIIDLENPTAGRRMIDTLVFTRPGATPAAVPSRP